MDDKKILHYFCGMMILMAEVCKKDLDCEDMEDAQTMVGNMLKLLYRVYDGRPVEEWFA